MALTTQERSAKAAEKRRQAGEEVLRLPVRPGTKTALLEVMARHGIGEMAEAVTLMIHQAHRYGRAWIVVPRHEITITENVAQKIAELGAAEPQEE